MSKDISIDDVFCVRDKFIRKFFKVEIHVMVAPKESKSEKRRLAREEKDQKSHIMDAILRIMKARHVLDHNSIVMEVT